jgi:hypothetical protein
MKFVADIVDTTDVVTKEYVDTQDAVNLTTVRSDILSTNMITAYISIWEESYYQKILSLEDALQWKTGFDQKIANVFANQ